MGFYKSPSKAHYGSKVIDEIYLGCGPSDLNKCIVKFPNASNYWYFTSRPTFRLTSSLGTFTPSGSCGGEVAFSCGDEWAIYYSNYFKSATTSQTSDGTWLLVRYAPYIGYIPRAGVEWDSENTSWSYSGDTWYSTSNLETLGDDGDYAGRFDGVSQDVSSSHIQFNISVDPVPSEKRSSVVGDWGSFYVGFPTWTFVDSIGVQKVIFKRWNGSFHGLRYVVSDNIDGVPCAVQGYIPADFPAPNLASGFFMVEQEPHVRSNFVIDHYHFTPFDYEHPREGGYLTKDSGPTFTVSWQDFVDEASLLAIGVPPRSLCKQINVFQTAIWR